MGYSAKKQYKLLDAILSLLDKVPVDAGLNVLTNAMIVVVDYRFSKGASGRYTTALDTFLEAERKMVSPKRKDKK